MAPIAGPTVTLEPVAGSPGAQGTARIIGRGPGTRLQLRIAGLPRSQGAYTVWLYDSVTDARPLASFRGSRARLDLRLPADLDRYHYLDVSREPRDGNPNHSGESVLRASLGRLARRG